MRRARLIPLCLFVVVTRAPAFAFAQVRVSAEAGLSRLRQTGIDESTARTLGLSMDAITSQFWLRSSALGAVSSADAWTGQAVGAASWFSRNQNPVRWELSALGSAFAEANRQTALSGEIMGRGHIGSAALGGALGLGGGQRRADTRPRAFGHYQANIWTTVAGNQLSSDFSLVMTSTEGINGRASQGLSYSDAAASWRRDVGGFSLGAVGGVRSTASPRISDGSWGGVDAAAFVTRRLAIVAAAGQTLDDVVRGVPKTRYVSVGLRWAAQPHKTVVPRSRPAVMAGPRLFVANRQIEIRLAGAAKVELMGDFTGWEPIALDGQAGVWRFDRALSPGLHRMAIRVDGGEWMAPVNVPHATDDLGSIVGLITIPDE